MILYVFAQSCGWCERNLDNVKALQAHTQADYDFVALSLEDGRGDLPGFVKARQLDWRIVRDVPFELLGKYRVSGTPLTAVLDGDGRVQHAWKGAWVDDAAEIERVFKLKLPGLRSVAPVT
jgi:hypothetical protein